MTQPIITTTTRGPEPGSRHARPATLADQDAEKGAVEGDRPDDPQHFNPNATEIDEHGLPDMLPVCEDAIGASADSSERARGVAGAAVLSNETGQAPVAEDPK